ncbi:MAG: HAD-IA family hydrolase [Gemmatimonadaceae bacterium]
MPAALLFDLDGTLVDSIELILGSARHAFIGFEGHTPTDEEWRSGIGRPLLTVLREYAGNDVEAERLLARYREYQLEHHDRLMLAYEGIVPALRTFAAGGHPLAVVTSKSDWLARKALELVGVDDLFAVLVGCDTCVNHKPHPEPVERALAFLGVAPSDAIFVGDSAHDVASGNAAGVYTVGVTWGAFARAELEAANADEVIDEVSQLSTVVERFDAQRARLQTF